MVGKLVVHKSRDKNSEAKGSVVGRVSKWIRELVGGASKFEV
jgi:hypothetical protein